MRIKVYDDGQGSVRIEMKTLDSNQFGDQKYSVVFKAAGCDDAVVLAEKLKHAFSRFDEKVHLVGYSRDA